MKYVAAVFIVISSIYLISFAKYNLKKKNKRAFAGALILVLLTIALPVLVMLGK